MEGQDAEFFTNRKLFKKEARKKKKSKQKAQRPANVRGKKGRWVFYDADDAHPDDFIIYDPHADEWLPAAVLWGDDDYDPKGEKIDE